MTNDQWGAVRGRVYGDAGVYCLVLWLARPSRLGLTRLGSCRLERGWYVYTGSAKRNLWSRLLRHLRRQKRRHWHVDHLRAVARVHQIWVWPWTRGGECRTNAMLGGLPGAGVPVKGFGSSDCRCVAHLVSFPADTAPPDQGAPLTWRVQGGRLAAGRMTERSHGMSFAPSGKSRSQESRPLSGRADRGWRPADGV